MAFTGIVLCMLFLITMSMANKKKNLVLYSKKCQIYQLICETVFELFLLTIRKKVIVRGMSRFNLQLILLKQFFIFCRGLNGEAG